jgi:MarR family transcriptional regulator, organic hydroperoxide resistance regulator
MDQKTAEYVVDQCACFYFRRASRVITQLFDRTLGPAGVRSTQLVILVLLQAKGAAKISEISEQLGLEQSSLSRIAQLLIRNGWVKVQKDKHDARVKVLVLASRGSRKIDEAAPYWKEAQSQVVENLGAEELKDLRGRLSLIASSMETRTHSTKRVR